MLYGFLGVLPMVEGLFFFSDALQLFVCALPKVEGLFCFEMLSFLFEEPGLHLNIVVANALFMLSSISILTSFPNRGCLQPSEDVLRSILKS